MLNNIRFKGEINGKTLKDYSNKIDWEITDDNKRIKKIKEILNLNEYGTSDDMFWQEVWDSGVCKAELSKTDTRWEETDVAHLLEVMGSYLIYGYIKKEKRKEKLEVKDNLSYEEYEYDGNYRLAPPEKINSNDYKMRDLYSGTYKEYVEKIIKNGYKPKEEDVFNRIKEHEEMKIKLLKESKHNTDILKKQMKSLKNNERLQFNKNKKISYQLNKPNISLNVQCQRYGLKELDIINKIEENRIKKDTVNRNTNVTLNHITSMLASQKDYEIKVKLSYMNRIESNPPKCSSYKNILENIDYLNHNHIKAMLYLKNMDLNFSNELSIISYDIHKKIKELYSFGELNNRDIYIIEGLSFGMSEYSLSKELGVNRGVIIKTIDKISNKIANSFYNDILDIYFLNERYGKYKKCNRCGEIKLTREFNKNGSKGLKPMCKKCRK